MFSPASLPFAFQSISKRSWPCPVHNEPNCRTEAKQEKQEQITGLRLSNSLSHSSSNAFLQSPVAVLSKRVAAADNRDRPSCQRNETSRKNQGINQTARCLRPASKWARFFGFMFSNSYRHSTFTTFTLHSFFAQ